MNTTPRTLIVLCIVTGALVAGCGGDSADQQQQQGRAPLVQCAEVESGTLANVLEQTGEVVAVNDVTLYALLEGPIVFLPWREGDTVRKGDKLVEIGRPLYREEMRAAEAGLEVARAKLADLKAGARPEEIRQARETVKQLAEQATYAESDLDRVGQLTERGALPGEELDKARVAAVRATAELAAARERLGMLERGPTVTEIAVQQATVAEAEARLALARAKLDESIVEAPFDGVVSQVFVSPGDTAMMRTPLLRLVDTGALVVRFSAPEARALQIEKEMPVTMRFDAYPGQEFRGAVDRVYPEIERDTRTRVIEARVDDEIALAPGMFARLAVQIEARENVVIVPDKAILTTPGGASVLFVVEDETAVRRTITTGMEEGTRIEVIEGATPGELVVVGGHERLRDGATVRVAGQQQGGSGGPSAQEGGQ